MPTADDFKRALENPQSFFKDSQFHAMVVDRGPDGDFIVYPGSFCKVYSCRLSCEPQQKTALRFFTGYDASTKNRYEALTDILQKHAAEFTTQFQYIAEAYFDSDNLEFHPILKMLWVEGESLIDQVKFLSDADDRKSLTNLCAAWQELVLTMQKMGLAHGDLSGKNVRYSNGKLILIDYDEIYFADSRLTANEPNGKGHPNYQHPETTDDRRPYDDHMDNFSALSIHASLLAYAERPALAKQFLNVFDGKHVEKEDQILFSREDYANPSRSMAFQAILKLPEGPARDACQRLKDACEGSLTQVPHFSDVCDPLTRLRELCSQSPPPWRAIYQEALRLRWDQNRPTPHKLSELNAVTEDDRVQQALLRCQTLDALITEIQKTPPKVRQIAIAFQKAKDNAIFDHWKEAIQYMAAGDQAESRCGELDELEEAEASDPSGRELVEIWSKRKGLLNATDEGQYWQRLIDSCEPVIDAIDHLFTLTAEPLPWPSDQAISQAWDALDRVFSGNANEHPEIENLHESVLSAILAAHARHSAHLHAKQLVSLETPSESSDRAAIDGWDESLLKDCPDVSLLLRNRWRTAVANAGTLARLEQCANQREVTKTNEQKLIEIASELPPGYAYSLRRRIETAVKRNETLANLNASLLDPISDIALSDAYRKLQDEWGPQPQHCGLSHPQQQRVERAIQRREIIQQLRALLEQVPLEEEMSETLDQQLARHWDDAIFREPPESEQYCCDVLDAPHHALQRATGTLLRLKQLASLRATEKEYQKGIAHSNDLLSAAALLPVWYLHQLSDYKLIEQVQSRKPYIDRLEAAITDNFDPQIAHEWQKIKQRRIPPHIESQRQRCEGAVRRCTAFEEWNQGLSNTKWPEDKDRRRIEIYESGDLANLKITDAHEKETIDARYKLAIKRRNAWQMLERAMAGPNDFEKREFDNEALLAEYNCYREIYAELAQVRVRTEKARAMIDALRKIEKDTRTINVEELEKAFIDKFDCQIIENHETYFKPYQELIVHCIKKHLFKRYEFKNLKPSISEQRPHVPKAKWQWPENDKKISHGIVAARWGKNFDQDERNNLISNSLGDSREVCRREFNHENSTVHLPAMQDFVPPLHVAIWPAVKIETLGILEIGPMQTQQAEISPKKEPKRKNLGLWHSIKEWIKRSLET